MDWGCSTPGAGASKPAESGRTGRQADGEQFSSLGRLLDTLTMRPASALWRSGRSACVTSTTPNRFVSNVLRQASIVWSEGALSNASIMMPALLTSTSM